MNEIKVVEWIDLENNKRTDLVGGEGKGPLYKELTTAQHKKINDTLQKNLIKIIEDAKKAGLRFR